MAVRPGAVQHAAVRLMAALLAAVRLMAGPLALAGCGSGAPECGPARAVVAEVVDGDTVRLEGGDTVRYLLVDTPELGPGSAECLGAEARALNRALVEGREVGLTYGEACRDRYGRLLAYVEVDGREVNALLVERGLGCVLYVPPAGGARREAFEALEAAARAAHRGLWGTCLPRPC